MELCITTLPAGQHRLDKYRKAQAVDPICSTVSTYCKSEWPDKHKIELALKPFWKVRGELTVHDNLLL